MNIILKKGKTTVEIAKPWTVYKGCRFDQNGIVTQVTYDGNTFLTKESLIEGEGTGGLGMCNEFGIRMAVGYYDVNDGELFTKIGTGILKRDAKPYYHLTDYEVIPFEHKIEQENEKCTFTCFGKECNGYNFIYKKTITVKENGLEIEYELKNTGEKPIVTDEYVHNFLCINNKMYNSDYELKSDVEDTLTEHFDFEFKNGVMTWDKPITQYYFADVKNLNWKVNSSWKLINKKEKLEISETTDFPAYKFNVWGMEHVTSPELFKQLIIRPDETEKWKRIYKITHLD